MAKDQHFKARVPGGTVSGVLCMPDKKAARGRTPLIVLHGGPGGNYGSLRFYMRGLIADRPVVFYDQLGSHSSPAPITKKLMDPVRFGAEVASVMSHLDMQKAAVLGHSWGASVAIEFALANPKRAAAVILSSPLISSRLWIGGTNTLLAKMPAKMREAIREHEAAGTTDDPAYEAANMAFMNRHLCRLNPWPKKLKESFSKTNRELYGKMWGASEFNCAGTLKTYDRFNDLKRIKAPILLMCGKYDEARPETLERAAATMSDATVHVLKHSSHTPYIEETKVYEKTVRGFLNNLGL